MPCINGLLLEMARNQIFLISERQISPKSSKSGCVSVFPSASAPAHHADYDPDQHRLVPNSSKTITPIGGGEIVKSGVETAMHCWKFRLIKCRVLLICRPKAAAAASR